MEHDYHPQVNCTACHDAGGLSIVFDSEPNSRHKGTYLPVRFAHTLTGWPSHNLQTAVDCKRCHHPRNSDKSIVAFKIGCDTCHTEGAVLTWCENFPRNPDPNELLTVGR
ncbi:MAG: hypothetical protein A2Z03_08805 [Chloroflexi bacterium RBG_16_56_8]|nr:MAG: hypothetical protein A2Z03_08805 [Chloroflexi bacterium RBG_16_56_8]